MSAATVPELRPSMPFLVRYYDAKASRRGQGVQARRFATREAAERFADGKRLYGRPARVVEEL